jgi:plastocyanin
MKRRLFTLLLFRVLSALGAVSAAATTATSTTGGGIPALDERIERSQEFVELIREQRDEIADEMGEDFEEECCAPEEGLPDDKTIIGERYFPNGTSIAYLNDGTTQEMIHYFNIGKGFVFDNTTIFYAGEMPEINNAIANASTTPTGIVSFVQILPGSVNTLNEHYNINPVRIHVGDTITWINNYAQYTHYIKSPPSSPSGITGLDMDSGILEPGTTFSHTFMKPGVSFTKIHFGQ